MGIAHPSCLATIDYIDRFKEKQLDDEYCAQAGKEIIDALFDKTRYSKIVEDLRNGSHVSGVDTQECCEPCGRATEWLSAIHRADTNAWRKSQWNTKFDPKGPHTLHIANRIAHLKSLCHQPNSKLWAEKIRALMPSVVNQSGLRNSKLPCTIDLQSVNGQDNYAILCPSSKPHNYGTRSDYLARSSAINNLYSQYHQYQPFREVEGRISKTYFGEPFIVDQLINLLQEQVDEEYRTNTLPGGETKLPPDQSGCAGSVDGWTEVSD